MLLNRVVHRQLYKVKQSYHTIHPLPSPYHGYWDLLLQQPKINEKEEKSSSNLKIPINVPTNDINPTTTPNITNKQLTKFVWFDNEKITLPEKPPPPENCCMSGCVHCVYDIYQEDMEFYKDQMNSIRQRFKAAGKELPAVLKQKKDQKPEDEMDPTMRAFLEMEKKLNAS